MPTGAVDYDSQILDIPPVVLVLGNHSFGIVEHEKEHHFHWRPNGFVPVPPLRQVSVCGLPRPCLHDRDWKQQDVPGEVENVLVAG